MAEFITTEGNKVVLEREIKQLGKAKEETHASLRKQRDEGMITQKQYEAGKKRLDAEEAYQVERMKEKYGDPPFCAQIIAAKT